MSARQILDRRLRSHHRGGLIGADVDQEKFGGRIGRWAIRGREQLLIDHYSGLGKLMDQIRGISLRNHNIGAYLKLAGKFFGVL